MARPIWSGHISFGLVNIPVQLHSAERRDWIHEKAARGEHEAVPEVPEVEAPASRVVDLMSLLKRSVEEQGGGKKPPKSTSRRRVASRRPSTKRRHRVS